MPTTIFYSWQSDSPNSTNRGFIEKALEQAIKGLGKDLTIKAALRDEPIELDKDTKGVPGTPPIVDTIFNKISECGVFVPDLTFVGTAASGRQLPNPNVLIEYGWALKSISHSRIVPVMNTAFGCPTPVTMPFDMRHLRNPITYHLEEATDAETKSTVKTQLIKDLQTQIGYIIKKRLLDRSDDARSVYSPVQPTKNPSTFLQNNEAFHTEGQVKPLSIPDVQRLFLRLIPSTPSHFIMTSRDALVLAQAGKLMPMQEKGVGRGWSIERNKYGAFAYGERHGEIVFFTQLFKTGELWGIDAYSLDKKICQSDGRVDFGYFPCVTLERVLVDTLTSYLEFASSTLGLRLPLRFIAGATDVEGYMMTAPSNMQFFTARHPRFAGRVVDQHIAYEDNIEDYSKSPTDILMPFSKHLWTECGLERPAINPMT